MFPSSPSLDQLHPASVDPGERQWKWNGFAWDAISAVSSLYVGTTDITFNTSPAARHLTGILSIDGLSASATKLETARTLTIGATGKAFDGTTNLTWTTEEIGAGGEAFDNIPNVTKNSNYTLVATDKGTVLTKTDATERTYTINNSVFSAGDFVGFNNANNAALIKLTIGAGLTVYFAGSTVTGNRVVAPRGMGWLYFRTASEAYFSGGGVG